jgi:ribosomal protein S18 acetylase RimI-like enzyme
LLLEAALATAKELQAEMISLGVAAFNQQAIAFYEKHGFTIRFYQMWQPIVSETKE